jgi:kynurenine formamidase
MEQTPAETPDRTRALSLVRSGELLDLSTGVSPETPHYSGLAPYRISDWTDPRTSREQLRRAENASNGIGFADERVMMDLHSGTHVDALGHAWLNGEGCGGIGSEEGLGKDRLRRLGADEIPAMVGRGVLLDVAADGPLEGGEAIGPAQLGAAARRGGVEIEPGDLVLIRTGWGALLASDPDRYTASWPGIGIDGARWLSARRPRLVGADNLALEVFPEERRGDCSPVHGHLLVEAGIYILELAMLDELAARGRYEFACLCLPVRYAGASASPVRLTAVL